MKPNRLARLLFAFIAIPALTAPFAVAQSGSPIVYPGTGTTLNGSPLYTAAPLTSGDTVQTGAGRAKVLVDGVEAELSPNTRLMAGGAIQMGCGTVSINAPGPFTLQAGSMVVRTNGGAYEIMNAGDGTRVTVLGGDAEVYQAGQNRRLKTGESYAGAANAECQSANLPDAPSTSLSSAQGDNESNGAFGKHHSRKKSTLDPTPSGNGLGFSMDAHVADRSYWMLTGTMFSSSISAAELTIRCIDEHKCTKRAADLPHNRAVVYGAGIPTEIAVSYLTYRLKRQKRSWWFVPAVLVTAGNTYMTIHSARWLGK